MVRWLTPALSGVVFLFKDDYHPISPETELNPEESDSVDALIVPDLMYYAAHVSNEDIGDGKPGGMYSFVIMPGPMDTSSDLSA